MQLNRIRRWEGRYFLPPLLPAVLLALPAGAAPNFLYVDCSGQPTTDFPSITEAINSLNGSPPTSDYDYILLRNDCTENVTITAPRRLWIAPAADPCPWDGCTTNKMVGITAADHTQAVLSIQTPENITLVHLSLSGGSTGLAVGANANVTAYGVVAENNVANADGNNGDGISVGMGGALSLGEGGSLNNSGWGIMAGNGASLDLYGRAGWLQNQPLTISGNGKGGITSSMSHVGSWMGVTIEDNAGWGLVSSGSDWNFGSCCNAESVIQRNEGGAFLAEGSSASFWGATTFRDNGHFGIYAEMGTHVTVWAWALDAGAPLVVEGHTKIGLNISANSQARIFGPGLFRHNGAPGEPVSAGIRVDGNSNAVFDKGDSLTGAEVRSNFGPGILVDLNSSIDATNAVVRGNAKEGVRLRHMSVAYMGPDLTIKANGGGVLTCDVTSMAVTDLVRRSLACLNVEKPMEPRPPWPPTPFK